MGITHSWVAQSHAGPPTLAKCSEREPKTWVDRWSTSHIIPTCSLVSSGMGDAPWFLGLSSEGPCLSYTRSSHHPQDLPPPCEKSADPAAKEISV